MDNHLLVFVQRIFCDFESALKLDVLSLLYCFCINKVLKHDDNRLMRHKVLPFGLFALGLQSDLMEETSSAEDSFYSDLCGRSREVYIGCFSLFFSTELKEKIGQPTRSVFLKVALVGCSPFFILVLKIGWKKKYDFALG